MEKDVHKYVTNTMQHVRRGAPKGVLISSVAPGSPAEFRGLQTNDVITLVNQQAVQSVSELQKLAEDQSLLVLKIHRGDRTLLRTIR